KVQSMAASSPSRPIAIVAHSMGGLLTGEMLRRHRAELSTVLGHIVTLGTPFEGSVKAYEYFRGWDTIMPNIISEDTTKAIGSNWTSAYQLLPRWDFVNFRTGPAPYAKVYDGSLSSTFFPSLPRQAALNQAYKLWSDSKNTLRYAQAYGVIGSGNLTPVLITDDQHCNPNCLFSKDTNGDKTVPLRSARASSWILTGHLRYVNEEHVGLPSNDDVITSIKQMLQNGGLNLA